MSIVGVPVMTKKSFIDTVSEMWKQALQQSMLEAGRREREIAIQKGHFHEGIPAITVIVDGPQQVLSCMRKEDSKGKPHLLQELDSILI